MIYRERLKKSLKRRNYEAELENFLRLLEAETEKAELENFLRLLEAEMEKYFRLPKGLYVGLSDGFVPGVVLDFWEGCVLGFSDGFCILLGVIAGRIERELLGTFDEDDVGL